ncbi:hypothetical protein MHPYR_180073 [uncultured Mycobacterium sp.]|uniref:Uncharacterized protein n=1 Tax=uncultured Mycobacterium sp. TaxID=171292 RepID=A0A1Y5P565_9MYCO|nr:hypothetical protein MHPYR_180073 [uncultured Mycobacterium sp.]
MPRLTVKLDDQVMFDREVDECEGKDERGGHFSLTAEYPPLPPMAPPITITNEQLMRLQDDSLLMQDIKELGR